LILVSSNNGLKEQNLQLEKESIKTLEFLKNAKQKVKNDLIKNNF
jgi:hypothetical protein